MARLTPPNPELLSSTCINDENEARNHIFDHLETDGWPYEHGDMQEGSGIPRIVKNGDDLSFCRPELWKDATPPVTLMVLRTVILLSAEAMRALQAVFGSRLHDPFLCLQENHSLFQGTENAGIPGEVLREDFLIPLGLSEYRVAKDIGVPARRINEIVKDKRALTVDTALRLERYFGWPAEV